MTMATNPTPLPDPSALDDESTFVLDPVEAGAIYDGGYEEGYDTGFEAALRQQAIGDDRTRRWLVSCVEAALGRSDDQAPDLAEAIADRILETTSPIPDEDPRPDVLRGMYGKYYVERLHDVTHKHDGDRFFVLDPLHDPYALVALRAYRLACAPEYPKLATDLTAWVRDLEKGKEEGQQALFEDDLRSGRPSV